MRVYLGVYNGHDDVLRDLTNDSWMEILEPKERNGYRFVPDAIGRLEINRIISQNNDLELAVVASDRGYLYLINTNTAYVDNNGDSQHFIYNYLPANLKFLGVAELSKFDISDNDKAVELLLDGIFKTPIIDKTELTSVKDYIEAAATLNTLSNRLYFHRDTFGEEVLTKLQEILIDEIEDIDPDEQTEEFGFQQQLEQYEKICQIIVGNFKSVLEYKNKERESSNNDEKKCLTRKAIRDLFSSPEQDKNADNKNRNI